MSLASNVCRPRSRTLVLLLALLSGLASGTARAAEIDPSQPVAALETFHDQFSATAYPYPRHSAKPLGTLGFDVWAEVAVLPDAVAEVERVAGESLTGDALVVYRVGARKGLPGGFDLGLSYGRALEPDIELVSAELSWAILEGGAATPALGLRATGTRTLDGEAYALDQYGLEVAISKGFAVLTPYAGAGFTWSESTFDESGGASFTTDSTRGFVFAGLILNLWVPKITFELEQADDLQGAVRLAFGL